MQFYRDEVMIVLLQFVFYIYKQVALLRKSQEQVFIFQKSSSEEMNELISSLHLVLWLLKWAYVVHMTWYGTWRKFDKSDSLEGKLDTVSIQFLWNVVKFRAKNSKENSRPTSRLFVDESDSRIQFRLHTPSTFWGGGGGGLICFCLCIIFLLVS